ncbi:MAG: universal stress protein [Chromatiales bacterium]|jgi:nucleotide-binding universal stress UspA family protein
MKRFKNILFFTDGNPGSTWALERAVKLATTNEARLTVMDVISDRETSPELEERLGTDLNIILRDRMQHQLEELIAGFREHGDLIYSRVETGIDFVEVIRAVLRNRHDLVMKAARPPEGFSRRLLGSTDLHLLRKCPCPVWIDRPTVAHPYRNILAAVNPSEKADSGCSRLVMDLASSLASRESAELSVVHAWQMHGESTLRNGRGRISGKELELLVEATRNERRKRLDDLLGHYGLNSEANNVHLRKGPTAATIRDTGSRMDADLLVMGTIGRTGIPGFFIGNTAEELLQTTSASILAVKPEGFVSPVTLTET